MMTWSVVFHSFLFKKFFQLILFVFKIPIIYVPPFRISIGRIAAIFCDHGTCWSSSGMILVDLRTTFFAQILKSGKGCNQSLSCSISILDNSSLAKGILLRSSIIDEFSIAMNILPW